MTTSEIEILNFNLRQKNTLRGFLDIALPSGMIIRNLLLFEKDGGGRWISLPSEKFTDAQGVAGYRKIIEFRDRESLDRFRDAVLAAFDQFQKTPPAKSGPATNQDSGRRSSALGRHR